MAKRFLVLVTIGVLALVSGCATKVERIDTKEVRDLSGSWNDTDSRLVSEEMIRDALSRDWLRNHTRKFRKQPTVIVGEVRNLSDEHISVETFVADMERALINSGKVQFVASSGERGEIREERRQQDIHSREDTRKPMGQEIGADYMLKGSIKTIVDVANRKQVRFYQVDLTLISIADNRKVWLGQKKIKKYIKRPRFRY
ncbi:MAG: penicillin-binding protein activator LpoB [Acidiferrobacterales bacterium]